MSLNFQYHTHSSKENKCFNADFQTDLFDEFIKTIADEDIGFFSITKDNTLIDETLKLTTEFSHKKHFVQVGIGGSALGPQMLVSALGKSASDKTFSLLDNTDADYLHDVLSAINVQDALFYVVSKSGGTAETIACYSMVRNYLKEHGIAEKDFSKYFVFCTDPTHGQLREHVLKNNFKSLSISSNIGGRFSVLSPVGLFPAAFMGMNIQELFNGANSLHKTLKDKNLPDNPLVQTATHLISLLPECHETVMMPYSSKLKDFSFWFVQLWAESLGKYSKAKSMPVGLTPIPAYGATDQHAQMQLFMEGPNNKCIFLISIEKRINDFKLDSNLELESAEKLKKYTMNELLEAEHQGTLMALKQNSRNTISIKMDTLNEQNLGALIIFFESLTCMMGHYFKIDPFNQPGVEKGKKYTFEYLHSLRK